MNIKAFNNEKSNTPPYVSVFSSLKIGDVNLPNRIVFPSFQTNYANHDGSVSDKLLYFYKGLADGGCGLIFTGCAVVSTNTIAFDRVMRIDKDTYIPTLKNLFYEIEKRGSIPGIQLIHYGRQALKTVTGCDLLAPSPVPCPVMSKLEPNYTIREMSLGDISRVRNDFIKAAARAVEAGAKVIEIHAAHGYLLNQFLSPYSNHRTDNYGGTLENRARFIVEIIRGVRTQIGRNASISVRVSGNEFVSNGLTPPDFKNIIPLLEEAGMNLLNVAAGVYESMERIVPTKKLGETPHVNIASELKKYASVPVCTVGSVFSLETAESIISSGKADLVAMGRAQVADPEIVRKSVSHREAEIRRCIRCNKCTYWTTNEPQMYCSVNPSFKREK